MGQACVRCSTSVGQQDREILSQEEGGSRDDRKLPRFIDILDKTVLKVNREPDSGDPELHNRKTKNGIGGGGEGGKTGLQQQQQIMSQEILDISADKQHQHHHADPIIQHPLLLQSIRLGESLLLSQSSSSSSIPPSLLLSSQQLLSSKLRIQRGNFVRLLTQKVNFKYNFHQLIGQGSYGRVYRATCLSTHQQRAIKVLPKSRISSHMFFSQMQLLRKMDHPNIIRLYEVYDYENFYFVVLEYCEGGELFHAIKKKKRYSEREAKGILRQLLSAVAYMHGLGIVHRDLKPENIVIESSQEARIKIIDFGSAVKAGPEEVLRKRVGSPYYMAPEVLMEEYTMKCDVWSCGVILFVLLSGRPPFRGSTQAELFRKISQERVHFDDKYWKMVSKQAKSLISKMMDKSPSRRITAAQATDHAWVNQITTKQTIAVDILKRIQKFSFRSNFLAIVQTYLASNTISQQQRSTLAKAFKQLDKNNSGIIQRSQLVEAYRNVYGTVNDRFVQQIINKVDTNDSGQIDFTEFITACSNRKKLFHKRALIQAFEFFDKDGTGYIDVQELRELLGEAEGGSAVSEIAKVMQELDADGDQKISKEEFLGRLMEEGGGE